MSNIISLNGTVAPPDPEVAVLHSRRRFSQAYKERILREDENCRETRQIAALLQQESEIRVFRVAAAGKGHLVSGAVARRFFQW